LMDEFELLVHPIFAGKGKPLFDAPLDARVQIGPSLSIGRRADEVFRSGGCHWQKECHVGHWRA
jgi:hypothetical protein